MAGQRKTGQVEFYDKIAPLYDLGIWLVGLFIGGEGRLRRKIVEALSPLRKGGRVLEIFAGTASNSLMASEAGAFTVALDISANMLKVAREKSTKSAFKRLLLVRADASSLPFSSGSFDRVIVSMGLHEVYPLPLKNILEDSFKVLRTGGRLVIFDYHRPDGPLRILQRLFFIFVETETALIWLAADIQGLLRKAGFRNFIRSFFLGKALQLITVEKP